MSRPFPSPDYELSRCRQELEEARTLVCHLRQEAQVQAQEAETYRAIVLECYQLVREGRGIPGSWYGAKPVEEYIDKLRRKIAELEGQATQEEVQTS